MLPLLIRVTNQDTGARFEAGFKRSPVRIGRNKLNDLAIDEDFVSQWHGLVRFDDEGTRFLDLGSTNGTFLGEDRLEKNVEIDLGEETTLEIGPLRIGVARLALTDEQILPRRAPPVSLGGTQRRKKGVGAGGTMELSAAASRGVDDFAKTLAQSMSGDPNAPSMDAIRDLAKRQKDIVAKLAPIYEKYEAARAALDEAVQEALGSAANPTERELCANLLSEVYPKAFEHAEVRDDAGMPPSGGGDVSEWVELVAPGTGAKAKPDGWDPLARAGAVLEAFASAYLDLRAGLRQVRTELGVDTGTEVESLPRFDDPRALIAYLFDPQIEVTFRLDELARGFADVAVHELGIVQGAVEGARSILTVLSPQGIGAETPGALARTNMGFGDVVWPFRAAGNYYRYVSKHLDVTTSQKFRSYLFGSAFGRAYYRVTGSKS